MPRVSVLLTSYNHVEFLPEALASLRAQTFQDFETLILDDGSTDGSREWLAENAADCRRIFQPKNLGTYGNLNSGIDLAEGEFIAIFNDDDVWQPSKLAKQVAALDADPAVGFVHTSGHFIGPKAETITGSPLGFPWPKTDSGDVFASLIYHNKVIASSVMARTSAVRSVSKFNEKLYGIGDWHLWLRLAREHLVHHIDEDLTWYRVHPNQACRDDAKMNADNLVVRDWIASLEPELRPRMAIDPALHAAMAHNWACLATDRMWTGDKSGSREALRQSLRLNPGRWKSYLRFAATFLPSRVYRKLN